MEFQLNDIIMNHEESLTLAALFADVASSYLWEDRLTDSGNTKGQVALDLLREEFDMAGLHMSFGGYFPSALDLDGTIMFVDQDITAARKAIRVTMIDGWHDGIARM